MAPSEIIVRKSLFGYERLNLSPYTFLHIDLFNQSSLKNAIVRNGVSLIFDLRFKPAFDEPRFQHRSLVEYFSQRRVVYIDCYFYSASFGEGEEVVDRYVEAMKGLKGKNFWTICLIDDDVLETELLPEFRAGFKEGENRFREVHPELFFGKERWASLHLDAEIETS